MLSQKIRQAAAGAAGGGGPVENMDLTSLISYWPMNEASGARADSEGANNLADGNTVTSTPGVLSNAAVFTRANSEYLSIADNAELSTGNIDFTWAGWVYLTSTPGDMDIISKYETATNNREYRLWYSTSRFRFTVIANGTGGGANEATAVANKLGAPTTGTWYFIRAWHDAGNDEVGIQVNDNPADVAAYANGVFDGASPLHIGALGRAALGNHLDGRVDEVSFWKRLLTDREHIQLYGDGTPPAYPLTGVPADVQPIFDGSWVWFSGPKAIRHSGAYDKTYVAWVSQMGSIMVAAYNHTDGIWEDSVPLHPALSFDDHAAPALLIRDSDKKIMAFYTAAASTAMRMRISSSTEDATAFAAEVDLHASIGATAYEYVAPAQLTSETNDPIYLFYMDCVGGSNRDLAYSKSSDGGATWSAQQRVFDNSTQRPYFHIWSNGTDRIDFVVTDGHPIEVATNSIYHFYYTGGNWYASDGTLLSTGSASLPLTPASVTQVYDGTTYRAWNWDIGRDGSGNPVILFSQFRSSTDHRAMYAKWNGTSWDVNEITATGQYIYAAEVYYSGGMALDHDDVNTVYLAVQVSGTFEIQKWATADGGATWAKAADVTSGSADDNYRPIVPLNSAADLKVLWLYGPYTAYNNFGTRIRTEPDTTR